MSGTLKAELLALADRVELAKWPDREIDARITYVIRPVMACLGTVEDYLTTGACKLVPAYTASINWAALLVPERRDWRVMWCDEQWCAIARIGEDVGLNTSAATPALALTAAALRARANEQDRS